MQKGLSIMKRIATFSVLLALLFSLFSCSENTEKGEHSVDAASGEYNGSSEDSKSVFFGDIEVPVDAEYQILVSDTFNVGGDYVSISSQVPQVTDDETEAINNRRNCGLSSTTFPKPFRSVKCFCWTIFLFTSIKTKMYPPHALQKALLYVHFIFRMCGIPMPSVLSTALRTLLNMR